MDRLEEVTLREHLEGVCTHRMREVEQRIAATERLAEARHAWSEQKIQETSVALSKRLDGMNEFRQALQDKDLLCLTRTEHDVYQRMVESDLRMLREASAESRGKASQSSMVFAYLLSGAALLLGLAELILRIVAAAAAK